MRIWIVLALFLVLAAGQSFAFDFPWGKGGAASQKAEDLYREARSAYGSADYTKCIDLAGKAIKENPKLAKAYALRGKAYKDMGDVDSAFKDLDKAIKLDPKLGEAYFIRGQAREIMGEMDKARADYKKGCAAGYRDACR